MAPLEWVDMFIWNSTTQPFVLLYWAIFTTLARLAYSILFVAKFGQTPGKMACGVKIFDVQGKAVMLYQAVLREIIPVVVAPCVLFIQVHNILKGQLINRALGDISVQQVSMVVFGWVLLEAVTMLTNKKRRAIHDFIADTVVMREAQNKKLLWSLLVLLFLSTIVSVLVKDGNIVGKA